MRERVLVSFLRKDIWLARSLTVKGPCGATRDVGCFTYLSERCGDGLSPNSVGSCPSPKIRRRAKSVGQSSPVHSCTFTVPGTRTRMTSAESRRGLSPAARGAEDAETASTPIRRSEQLCLADASPRVRSRSPTAAALPSSGGGGRDSVSRRRSTPWRCFGVERAWDTRAGKPPAAGSVLSNANQASVWAWLRFSEHAPRPRGTRLAVGHVALVGATANFSGAGVASRPRAPSWAGRS